MNIWLLVWAVLSLGLVGFMGWTYYILLNQKKAWKSFAQKKKLRYKPNGFSQSPEIAGTVKFEGENYTINFFTGQHISDDVRSARKLTAIEIRIPNPPPFEGAFASAGMVDFTRNLEFSEEIRPKHPQWNKTYIAISNAKHLQEAYLTQQRLDSILELAKMKNAWVIVVFKDDINLLRVDTPDALITEKSIQSVVSKMLKTAHMLQVDETEIRQLKAAKAKTPQKQAKIETKDDIDTGGLSLED